MKAAVITLPRRLPDSANFHDAALHAHARGQHLVHRGDGDVFVSPQVLPGWFKVGIRIKPAAPAPDALTMEAA